MRRKIDASGVFVAFNVGHWICADCGRKYGKCVIKYQTHHIDICEYCGEEKACTETRDWGYPELPKGKNDD